MVLIMVHGCMVPGCLVVAAMILMWLIPVVLVVALVVFLTKRSGPGSVEKTTLDILKERYARGEIGKDEFNQKKHDIGS